jgi:two-component system, cell cycle response regulator
MADLEAHMDKTDAQSILVIDDSADIHHLIDARLKSEGVPIHHAHDAYSGLQAMREFRPDLVLLDIDMPGRDGLALCREIKDDPTLSSIVIIFLTGNLDVETKVKAFDSGATDYVTKPFDAVELRARVRSGLRTKRYLDMLASQSQIDGLTGLWNRSRFDAVLEEEHALWLRGGRSFALAMLDIDHFKLLNDTYGHPFGDEVLRRVADTIKVGLRQSETAFRYGGEEFGVVFRGLDLDSAVRAAERLRLSIAGLPLAMGSKSVSMTASLGVASVDLPGVSGVNDLVACADKALYDAKRAGRNRVGRSAGR